MSDTPPTLSPQEKSTTLAPDTRHPLSADARFSIEAVRREFTESRWFKFISTIYSAARGIHKLINTLFSIGLITIFGLLYFRYVYPLLGLAWTLVLILIPLIIVLCVAVRAGRLFHERKVSELAASHESYLTSLKAKHESETEELKAEYGEKINGLQERAKRIQKLTEVAQRSDTIHFIFRYSGNGITGTAIDIFHEMLNRTLLECYGAVSEIDEKYYRGENDLKHVPINPVEYSGWLNTHRVRLRKLIEDERRASD